MTKKLLFVWLIGIFFFLQSATPTLAGSALESCSGKITDEKGNKLNGVTISCTGGENLKCTNLPQAQGNYRFDIEQVDPLKNARGPYEVTFQIPGYESIKMVVQRGNLLCPKTTAVTLKQDPTTQGYRCENYNCVPGNGGFSSLESCEKQCKLPPEAWCCVTINNTNSCSSGASGGCFRSNPRTYTSEGSCIDDCIPKPTPTLESQKHPDLCPDSAPFYSTVTHHCCVNKQEGWDDATGNCIGSVQPVGCKASKSTTYNFDPKYNTCTPTGRTGVFLCVAGTEKDGGCQTALGPIATDPGGFVTKLLSFALPTAIFITLMALIYAGYQIVVSQGNPEKVQASKELATSVFVGLLLLVFSAAILQMIGVNILGLTP